MSTLALMLCQTFFQKPSFTHTANAPEFRTSLAAFHSYLPHSFTTAVLHVAVETATQDSDHQNNNHA